MMIMRIGLLKELVDVSILRLYRILSLLAKQVWNA